ncbi:MAG: choice-of-anchor tandem repeat GloVer-containing protein [Terriglobales bacterium]
MHAADASRLKVSQSCWRAGAPHIRALAECVGACAAHTALILTALSAFLLAAAPAQAKAPKETVLYSFCPAEPNCTAGGGLESPLTMDAAGNFYGTTSFGGIYGGLGGTVFELSPNGSGGWNETNLYNFCSLPNCADGEGPGYSGVIFDSKGNLYGTAGGGAYGYGVVFELSPVGGNWTETVLYNFAGGAGAGSPVSGLIMDAAGNLYGTTYDSDNNYGAVFELSPSGGGWTEQVIYETYTDAAGLTMDAAGNIFGIGGSTRGHSSVFELSPNGNGGWNPTVIHTFAQTNMDPQGTLALDPAGSLYGTTLYGGAKNAGTVYKLTPAKQRKWTFKILHSFDAQDPKDGNDPWGGVVLDAAGNIYGTTAFGGDHKTSQGTIFELVAPVGKSRYKEQVIASFNGKNGLFPIASLIRDSAGNFYGTTYMGGAYDNGIVFAVTP